MRLCPSPPLLPAKTPTTTPRLPGRPRLLPEAPPTPHGRGVSDLVHLSRARDMVTPTRGATRQDQRLHAKRRAGPVQRSEASAVRSKAEVHRVGRGQGPVSFQRAAVTVSRL